MKKFDENYSLIFSNLFLSFSKLNSIAMVTTPVNLLLLCNEINYTPFIKLNQKITKTNSFGVIYSDMVELLGIIYIEIETKIKKKINQILNIRIVQLLKNNPNEIEKIIKLLIIYAFISDKKNLFKSRLNHLPRSNIELVNSILYNIFQSNEDNNNNNDFQKIVYEQKEEIQNLTQQIEKLKFLFNGYKNDTENQINGLKTKIETLNEKIKIQNFKEIKFRDYQSLKEKCMRYEKALAEYEALNESFKDRSFESTRNSIISEKKWELSEQDYLKIIAKKDFEIERLKSLLKMKNKDNEKKLSK